MFDTIQFTEDETIACRNAKVLDGLGTLKLKLMYGTAGSKPVENPTYPTGPIDQTPIHRALATELEVTERAV